MHIADVAHYVMPLAAGSGGAPARDERIFPGPCRPHAAAGTLHGHLQPAPELDRLVLSCTMEIDHRGEIVGYEINRGGDPLGGANDLHGVNASLKATPNARARYAAQVAHFERMRDLALILNRKRERRGSIDFDLPEPVIEFDEFGLMKSITRSERNVAHRLIEEFMLSANECVAQLSREQTHCVAVSDPREAGCQARVWTLK